MPAPPLAALSDRTLALSRKVQAQRVMRRQQLFAFPESRRRELGCQVLKKSGQRRFGCPPASPPGLLSRSGTQTPSVSLRVAATNASCAKSQGLPVSAVDAGAVSTRHVVRGGLLRDALPDTRLLQRLMMKKRLCVKDA